MIPQEQIKIIAAKILKSGVLRRKGMNLTLAIGAIIGQFNKEEFQIKDIKAVLAITHQNSILVDTSISGIISKMCENGLLSKRPGEHSNRSRIYRCIV